MNKIDKKYQNLTENPVVAKLLQTIGPWALRFQEKIPLTLNCLYGEMLEALDSFGSESLVESQSHIQQ